MTPGSIRLFVAATPPREHLEWVQEQIAGLEARWPAARWIPRENQHVTLKFLGATAPELIADVTGACRLAASRVGPARIGLGKLGAFPSPRRARVLWLGLHDPAVALVALAAALEAALEPIGFAPEKRSFSPHLTLARFRNPEKLGSLPALEGVPPAPFALSGFGLWRSHLSSRGARYEAVEHFHLG